MTARFELRLLGPPVILVGGLEVGPPTRKSLALLAYLSLEGESPRGKLADLLWGDLDEEGARKNLRKELFRLRETPVRDFLETPQDRVRLLECDVDALRFAHLAESGEAGALEQYRGEFLGGLEVPGALGFDEWLDAQRERFAELYRRALSARARALEASGDLRGALGVARTLVEADALQESAHRELMRLQARLGDRAGALEQYRRLEKLLQDELGLEPLPETTALARRIEAAQLEPEAPEETPASSPAEGLPNLERPPLVGREGAWAWLERLGRGMGLILAESGVGKTRLATDFARASGPMLVLRGFESASATPLYPVAEALRAALENGRVDPNALEPMWRREAARLVPEFAARTLEPDGPPSSEGRARFLEGLTQTVLAVIGTQAATIVLDDLHWFDASSLELVAHLVRRVAAGNLGIRVIATARRFETTEHATLAGVLAGLEREGLLERCELEPLTEAETRSLVQTLSGERAERFARRLFEATGGNPLFALETLRGLFSDGTLRLDEGRWITPFDQATEDYAELPIPPGVRELALARIERLGPACRRYLEAACLAGEPFDTDALEGATALSEWEGLEALERAIQAQVIEAAGDGYRFAHDLVRRTLADGLGAERRRLTHRRLAANLIESRGAPNAIAGHLEAAGRERDAIPWRVKAAEAAEAVYAHVEARAHLARALELGPDDDTAFEIHQQAAGLEVLTLDLDGLERHADAMLELAEGIGEPALEAEAQLTRARARLFRGDYAGGLELAERASSLANDDETRAEAALVSGTALIGLGRAEEAAPRLLGALEPHRGVPIKTVGDLHGILKVLYQQRGQLEHALDHARQALGAYRTGHAREDELKTLAQLGQTLGQMGRSSEALEHLERAVSEARRLGFDRTRSLALVMLADEGLRSGQLETAERAIGEGLELAGGRILVHEAQLTSLAGRLHRRAGRLGEAVIASRHALHLTEQLGLTAQRALQHLLNAELWLGLGAQEAAHADLEVARTLVPTSLKAYATQLETLLARLELEGGQAQTALERLEASRDAANRASPEQRANHGCALAQVHLRLEDAASARRVLEGLQAPAQLEVRVAVLSLEAGVMAAEPAEHLLEHASPLEALELHRALGHHQDAERLREQLAATLEAEPELRAGFLEHTGLEAARPS